MCFGYVIQDVIVVPKAFKILGMRKREFFEELGFPKKKTRKVPRKELVFLPKWVLYQHYKGVMTGSEIVLSGIA